MRPTGPGQPAHLLLDVVDILNELAIPYAMVGALAVSYHGLPRHTNDAEATVWLSGTGMTPKDLTDRLHSSGYRVTFHRGYIDDPVAAAMIVEDEHPNRIDLEIWRLILWQRHGQRDADKSEEEHLRI